MDEETTICIKLPTRITEMISEQLKGNMTIESFIEMKIKELFPYKLDLPDEEEQIIKERLKKLGYL